MKKPAWYNWTGYAHWDDYCAACWIFIFIPGFSFIGFCIWLIANGRVS